MRHIKIEVTHVAFDRHTKIFTKIVSTAKTNKELKRDLRKAGNGITDRPVANVSIRF